MKRVKVKIKKCSAIPKLNGLIIEDMDVNFISNKKPRMTIEDLAMEMCEGFKRVDTEIANIKVTIERNNIHFDTEINNIKTTLERNNIHFDTEINNIKTTLERNNIH